MIIKKGVIMQGLQLPMRKALKVADAVYKKYGQELTITSALDGTHSAGSYHYFGYAIDTRTYYFSDEEKIQVTQEIQSKLSNNYTVILEKTHIHIQYNAD